MCVSNSNIILQLSKFGTRLVNRLHGLSIDLSRLRMRLPKAKCTSRLAVLDDNEPGATQTGLVRLAASVSAMMT